MYNGLHGIQEMGTGVVLEYTEYSRLLNLYFLLAAFPSCFTERSVLVNYPTESR